MKKCEHCRDWFWTHNTWGDCKNLRIAKSPESRKAISLVEVCTVPRSKTVHFATEANFGCVLFSNKFPDRRKTKKGESNE